MEKDKNKNIIVTFDISSIAGRDQLAGVLKYLRTRPNWIPRLISRPVDFTADIVREAKAEHIDGIIINHAGSPETEQALAESDVPLAVIGIRNPKLLTRREAIAFIRNDNIETGHVAARYFRSLGSFNSYGFIPDSEEDSEWSRSRASGFKEALEKFGAQLQVYGGAPNTGTESAKRELIDWLKALPKPAAILAAWDQPAMQAIELCHSEGMAVPREICMLGVDDDPIICDAAIPRLSSIPFDYERQGYESGATLDILIRNPAKRHEQLTVVCHPLAVHARESSAPVSSSSALVRQAMRYIRRNAHKGASSRDVAKAMKVSTSLLSLRFREFIGNTITDELVDVRIAHAKKLLAETQQSIAQVLSASGFGNRSYAQKLFKNKTGMTMREYRISAGGH